MFVFQLISQQLVDTVFLCSQMLTNILRWLTDSWLPGLPDKLCLIAAFKDYTQWCGWELKGQDFSNVFNKMGGTLWKKDVILFSEAGSAPEKLLSERQSWLNMLTVHLRKIREATPDLWADFSLPLEY